MRGIRVSIVLAVAFVIGGHAPGAWACSCAALPGATNASYFKNADAVFVGTVTSRSNPTDPFSSSALVTWTFKVSSVQKGTVRSTQQVKSESSGASCGFTFTLGRRYQVFAYDSGSELKTGLCSGNHLVTTRSSVDLPPTGERAPPALIGVLLIVVGAALRLRRDAAAR